MSAALKDLALVWRAALAVRHPYAHAWVCFLALLAALCVGGLTLLRVAGAVDALLYGLRAGWAVLVFAWLLYFISGAAKLNTPANAVLVPRMRRSVLRLMVLAWLSATVLSALLALGSAVRPQLVFLAVGFWLVVLGLARSSSPVRAVAQVMLPFLALILIYLPQAWRAVLASPAGFVAATVLLLGLGAWTLERMFPQGGDHHFQQQAKAKLAVERIGAEGWSRQPLIPRIGRRLYQAALRRDCERRDSGALLMHLFGPDGFWTQRCLALLVMVAGAALLMPVLRLRASPGTIQAVANGSWFFASTLLFIPFADYQRRLARLSVSRGEQGLVKLAPGMPGAAAAFNRHLAARLLRAGLAEWGAFSAAVLAVVAITGAAAETLWMQACVCCLPLPLLASTLRDHARRGGGGGAGGWPLFFALLGSSAACWLAGALATRYLGAQIMPVAALASVVLAAALVAWRWRRLAGAPHAFPVGRLA